MQDKKSQESTPAIVMGADRLDQYIPLLRGKRVAFAGNKTSTIGKRHLVDSLLSLNIDIIKVFSPEHGFRGEADAGEEVQSSVDSITHLPIISLYGKLKKPTAKMLKGIDVLLFDIQDVGVRFYTYTSTLSYLMQACAEQNIPIIILDRPNPNGYYIDGPILEKKYSSFVGMYPVPIVFGMTIGEYAEMLVGESWLPNGEKPDLKIIKMKNYNHKLRYQLPIKPSPNLPNMEAVYLYPSLCLFEGTAISVGRGTNRPFQQFGHPDLKNFDYQFTPHSVPGAKNPKLDGQLCYGELVVNEADSIKDNGSINLQYLIRAYQNFPDKEDFFNNYFNLLAGNASLQREIKEGWTAKQIHEKWKVGLEKFQKEIRSKYLLYEDF